MTASSPFTQATRIEILCINIKIYNWTWCTDVKWKTVASPQITSQVFWSFPNAMARTIWFSNQNFRISHVKTVRDGPLENLLGGGGAGEVQKNNSRKGKWNEKNSCTPINPKKYSCYGLKNIHTRNLIAKKIPSARKFPSSSPTHNFSNGPSLNGKCPKYPTLTRPSTFTNRL